MNVSLAIAACVTFRYTLRSLIEGEAEGTVPRFLVYDLV
jgi:hypothetical protein